jgi:hypothetical protein
VIVEFEGGDVRFDGDRPVAVGEQPLANPTQLARTPSGTWALYALGDEVVVVQPWGALRGPAGELAARLRALGGDAGRDEGDREAATTLLALVDGRDEAGRPEGPRSIAGETGLPPTAPLSGPRNLPVGPAGSASGGAGPDAPAP